MKSEKVSNKDWGFLIVLFVIVIALGGYLAWFHAPYKLINRSLAISEQSQLSGIAITRGGFDSDLFADSDYKNLKIHKGLPKHTYLQKRDNPFRPSRGVEN